MKTRGSAGISQSGDKAVCICIVTHRPDCRDFRALVQFGGDSLRTFLCFEITVTGDFCAYPFQC